MPRSCDTPGQGIVVYQGNCTSPDASVLVAWYTLSNSLSISFKPEEGSSSDSPEQMTGYFPLDLLSAVHEPTIFEVTSGYSTSENNFLREWHLLAELETGAVDSRLNTDGLLV